MTASMGFDQVGDERSARLALACASEPADTELLELVVAEGPEEVWHSLIAGRSGTRWARRRSGVRLGVVGGLMERHGIRFVIPGDEEWPENFDVLEHARHKLDENRDYGGLPLGLWVCGPGHLAEWSVGAVGIVGSRAATRYGEAVAAEFAADLAASGRVVISGGAYGIDVAAHRGAIAAGGRTVAVVAGGPERNYPSGNSGILTTMRTEHLMISEVPPGSNPTRFRFLSRNRLIAGYGPGTVVVEAAARSGAINTAKWADQCSRVVMAVPGPVTSQFSQGTHGLIRDNAAALVACGDHVRELIGPLGQDALPLELEPERALDRLTARQQSVFEMVPGRGGISAGEISLQAGLDLLTTITVLAELDELGFVVDGERGWKLKSGSVG